MSTPLLVWVPGIIRNPLNHTWHWAKRRRWAREWRDTTHLVLTSRRNGTGRDWWTVDLAVPKQVTFTAHLWNRLDTDGLQAALKPVRDALQGIVIQHDGPACGHTFIYDQVIDRTTGGIEVKVELLESRSTREA